MNKKISFVFGTRPEGIKLAPVIKAFKAGNMNVEVVVTGQHRTMLDQVLQIFEITPDVDLNLMSNNQSLAQFTAKAIATLDSYFAESKPDFVVVQGDTNTVFAASLAAFYHKISVIHVEAGLRTGNKYSPFPEEMNRLLTGRIADLHFAPTQLAKDNLLKENVNEQNIYITGNTGIDSLLYIVEKLANKSFELPGIAEIPAEYLNEKRLILITGHRRENFGAGFENMCDAIRTLATNYPDYLFVYPVHLNPNVQAPVYERLGNMPNIKLMPPQDYVHFAALMQAAHIILTDSGGVQEEAPSLNTPILVMREDTERPEGVEAGCAILVGTDKDKIVANFDRLMQDKAFYEKMAQIENPYGDGTASAKILSIVQNILA